MTFNCDAMVHNCINFLRQRINFDTSRNEICGLRRLHEIPLRFVVGSKVIGNFFGGFFAGASLLDGIAEPRFHFGAVFCFTLQCCEVCYIESEGFGGIRGELTVDGG